MLEATRSPQLKEIYLCLDHQPLQQLLSALAMEWGYHLLDQPHDAALFIASEGIELPGNPTHVLRLSQSHYHDNHRLELPLTVELLYLALENHFHRTPRNHIRIRIERPIRLLVRQQEYTGRTITLSDRGMRFDFPQELARDERLEISLNLDGEQYQMPARVVYALVGKELGWGDRFEIGVVCHPLAKEIREKIRGQIIGTYLQRARPHLGSNLFAEALRQLNLTRMAQTIALEQFDAGLALQI